MRFGRHPIVPVDLVTAEKPHRGHPIVEQAKRQRRGIGWWHNARVPRPSPQTERLVDVFELLAGHGECGRTLAEIARSLGVDKATCYPMLTELTRVGWLVRHPGRKTFHLGPKLVAIGRAAQSAIDLVDLARSPLIDLAERVGSPCMAVTGTDEDLVVGDVVLLRDGRGRRRALNMRAGDRVALRPPLGAVFVAWSNDADIGRWLDRRESPAIGMQQRQRYRDILGIVRRRGFAVEQYPTEPARLADSVNELATAVGSRRQTRIIANQTELYDEVLIGEIELTTEYRPNSISAPVFDGDGNVVLALCIVDLASRLTGAELNRLAAQLTDTAANLTNDVHGRRPLL